MQQDVINATLSSFDPCLEPICTIATSLTSSQGTVVPHTSVTFHNDEDILWLEPREVIQKKVEEVTLSLGTQAVKRWTQQSTDGKPIEASSEKRQEWQQMVEKRFSLESNHIDLTTTPIGLDVFSVRREADTTTAGSGSSSTQQ